MNLYLRLLKYIRPYMHRLMMAILCTVMASACNLYLPWIIKDVVDKVLVQKDTFMLYVIAISIVVIFIIRIVLLWSKLFDELGRTEGCY